MSDGMTEELNKLIEMNQAGHLTDEEFAAAKAKLLQGESNTTEQQPEQIQPPPQNSESTDENTPDVSNAKIDNQTSTQGTTTVESSDNEYIGQVVTLVVFLLVVVLAGMKGCISCMNDSTSSSSYVSDSLPPSPTTKEERQTKSGMHKHLEGKWRLNKIAEGELYEFWDFDGAGGLTITSMSHGEVNSVKETNYILVQEEYVDFTGSELVAKRLHWRIEFTSKPGAIYFKEIDGLKDQFGYVFHRQ